MAARAWANGTLCAEPNILAHRDDDDAFADARRFGIDENKVKIMLEAQNNNEAFGEFGGVWPVNAQAVHAFIAVCSQWRTMGTLFAGLDYVAVKVVFKAMKIKLNEDLLMRLQVMEFTAAKALNGGNINGISR